MRDFRIMMFVFVGVIFLGSVSAQESDNETAVDYNQTYISSQGRAMDKTNFKLEEGMEIVKLKGVNAIMPKGSKVTQEHGMIKLEDSSEYLGRKLADFATRLQKIEATQSDQQKQMEEINKRLDKIK